MNCADREYRERMQSALRAAEICIFEVDLTGQRYTFFENSECIFYKSGEQILREIECYVSLPQEEYQKGVTEYFCHPGDKAVVDKAFEAIGNGHSYTYEARMKAGDQEYTWCRLNVAPVMENDVPVKMVGIISNIQLTREKMDSLKTAVYQDPYTKLLTKTRLKELTDLVLGEKPFAPCVMLAIDLDHFKSVNDTYGHTTGDEVLFSVAAHLKSLFRKTDIVSRFGGDEFAVLMVDCELEAAERKVRQFLSEKDNAYGVTKSVGIAARKSEDMDFESLFRKADKALYLAKRTRNTYHIFE